MSVILLQVFTNTLFNYIKNGPSTASFSFIFCLFKQTSLQCLHQIYVKNVHPAYCTGIRTHNLWNVSLFPLPLDQGSRPLSEIFINPFLFHLQGEVLSREWRGDDNLRKVSMQPIIFGFSKKRISRESLISSFFLCWNQFSWRHVFFLFLIASDRCQLLKTRNKRERSNDLDVAW